MDNKRHYLTLKIIAVSILMALLMCPAAHGGALMVYPKFVAFDSNGDPLVGGKLYTYEQGTTTEKTTYSDRDLSTPNANPVVLNSRGEATVYGTGFYKFVLKDSDDTTVWTVDELLAGEEVDWVSIGDYGDSLSTAVSDIGSDYATLVIDSAITVSSNVTVPSNIHLFVLNVENGAIQVDSGKTVTYNCPITAGDYQIFGGSGTHTTTNTIGIVKGKWSSSGTDRQTIKGELDIDGNTDSDWLTGFLNRPRFVYVESLDFTSGGTTEVEEGDVLVGATGGGEGTVEKIVLSSGSWAGGDAAGVFYIHTRNATAFEAENLNVDGGANNVATIAAASNKDAIVIYPGIYYHKGTDDQVLKWTSKIAFEFGSGGSNSSSEDLGNSEWHYLYIDDSAVVSGASRTLTSSEFINATEAPDTEISLTKMGYYPASAGTYVTTSDLCIGAFRTDGSADILEFFHDGGRYVEFADEIESYSLQDVDVTWIDVTLTIPVFSTKAMCEFHTNHAAGSESILYYRTNGQTGTTGKRVAISVAGATNEINSHVVFTDSSQIIEIVHGADDNNQASVYTHGWYFPKGM